jgi:hypothetical protein
MTNNVTIRSTAPSSDWTWKSIGEAAAQVLRNVQGSSTVRSSGAVS